MPACGACVVFLQPRYQALSMKLMRAWHLYHIILTVLFFLWWYIVLEELLAHATITILQGWVGLEGVNGDLFEGRDR